MVRSYAPFSSQISIHALREEGDLDQQQKRKSQSISIHALREEGDLYIDPTFEDNYKFLSTPSARRATPSHVRPRPDAGISIHALREEGDSGWKGRAGRFFYFYPRPPRGGRRMEVSSPLKTVQFLSTPSARRATALGLGLRPREIISIHALREEGDSSRCSGACCHHNFYPRPPRGGRPVFLSRDFPWLLFLSTHRLQSGLRPRVISIHALREEGDLLPGCSRSAGRAFLSTPSARRATFLSCKMDLDINISIHALREEGDACRAKGNDC